MAYYHGRECYLDWHCHRSGMGRLPDILGKEAKTLPRNVALCAKKFMCRVTGCIAGSALSAEPSREGKPFVEGICVHNQQVEGR